MMTNESENVTKTDNNSELSKKSLVNDFLNLWNVPTSVRNPNSLTENDRELLNKLPKIVDKFNPMYSGEITLYWHNKHEYVYTTNDRPHDGTLKWFLESGLLIRTSPIHFWSQPTQEKIDDERNWLSSVEKIGSFNRDHV